MPSKSLPEITEELRQTVAGALNLPPDAVGPDAAPGVTPGWDSLKHMRILMAVEARFGIEIPDELVVKLLSLAAIAECVSQRLNSN